MHPFFTPRGVVSLWQERMRTLKNDCSALAARVAGFGRALSLLVENETSMALMNLSILRDQVTSRFIRP